MAQEKAYGISGSLLMRERDRCLQFLEGEMTRQEFEHYANRARLWRLRNISPQDYKKYEADRSKRWTKRAGKGLPT